MSGVSASELAAVELLAHLPEGALAGIAEQARVRRFRAGDVIFSEGETGTTLHIVRAGRIRLVRSGAEGGELVLETYEPGGYFGELAVLDPAPRSATAVVLEDAETVELDKADLDRCFDDSAQAARGMLGVLARSLTKAKEVRTRELYESRLETIYTLAAAAELYDADTGLHISRMAQYCARLGLAAGMSKTTADLLLNASMMHDIGKIGLPDSLVRKPGKFEPHEYEQMKRHPRIGEEILSTGRSELLVLGARIALAHHERWDGSGYPNGLKGEQIPFEGRVCALADVFDALTSRRPYKEPWPVERAVDELRRESEAAFDPDLVQLFGDIVPEIEEIKERFSPAR